MRYEERNEFIKKRLEMLIKLLNGDEEWVERVLGVRFRNEEVIKKWIEAGILKFGGGMVFMEAVIRLFIEEDCDWVRAVLGDEDYELVGDEVERKKIVEEIYVEHYLDREFADSFIETWGDEDENR